MGIRRNFAYSSILTISGYFFSLLTYPYVSRTLGVTNIGICNFIDSLINYAILFSMMGITTCGIREIASNRNNPQALSKTFSSLIVLNAICTGIAVITLLIAMYTVEQLFPYRNLLYIGLCKLLMNILMVEWFFTGMENFAYITKRSLIIKATYVSSVFLLIHNKEDYTIYYILTTLSFVLNALINFVYSHKFIHLDFRHISIKPYLSTFFSIGLYKIITSFYTTLNSSWLGFVTNMEQVGYFSTSNRLYIILAAIFTAFTGVMLPRLSSLLSQGETKEFWEKIELSIEALFAFTFPIVCLSVIFGPYLLHTLVGDGFEGAYVPFQIIAPLIFVIGYEQILIIQIMLPMKFDKIILINSTFGALLAIALDIIIVKELGALGTAIVWAMSEICILLLSLRYITRNTLYRFPTKKFFNYCIAYIPLSILLLLLTHYLHLNDIIMLSIAGIITFLYSVILQIKSLRCPIVLQTLQKMHLYDDRQ